MSVRGNITCSSDITETRDAELDNDNDVASPNTSVATVTPNASKSSLNRLLLYKSYSSPITEKVETEDETFSSPRSAASCLSTPNSSAVLASKHLLSASSTEGSPLVGRQRSHSKSSRSDDSSCFLRTDEESMGSCSSRVHSSSKRFEKTVSNEQSSFVSDKLAPKALNSHLRAFSSNTSSQSPYIQVGETRSAKNREREKDVAGVLRVEPRKLGTHKTVSIDPNIPQEVDEDVSIIQRIYLRAAADLHSNDGRKLEHARLMLHRLKQAGFEPRPKSLSHPQPATLTRSSAPASVKVTVADLSGPHATSTPNPDRPRDGGSLTTPEDSGDGIANNTGMLLSYFKSGVLSPASKSFSVDSSKGADSICLEHQTGKAQQDHQAKMGRLCNSRSDPNLYKNNGLPLSVLLGAMETTPTARRKDSVISFRKRSSVPMLRKNSFLAYQLTSRSIRRHSCREALSLLSRNNQQPSPSPYDFQMDEPDASTWSVLMSSLPAEDRRLSQIRRQHLVISVPVCVVGKENPVTFTSMEAIERTLRRLHPEVLVKKKTAHEEGLTLFPEKEDTEGTDAEPPSSSVTSLKRERKQGVVTPPKSRQASITASISSMRTYTTDYDLQLEGVKSIGAFAEEETLKVLFAKPEAISCIIDAMQRFQDKEDLQINACISLLKMASASESNCVHIVRNNGVTAINSSLRRHLYNPDIVRKLINIVTYISTAVNLAETLVAEGLHSEMLSAMSRHDTDREIVRESCFIIGNLLVTEETVHQLMLVGGVHTIISLMQKFPNDEAILENACRTLGCFAIYDDTCLDVAKAGATRAVVEAMRPTRKNIAVFECGLWALASLTGSALTCEEVVTLGGIPIVLNILRENPDENLQEYGMRTLYNLASSELTAGAVSVDLVPDLVQQVLANFPESVELLEITLMTLSQVMLGDESLYHTVTSTHCVQNVITIMTNFPENTGIQESGCKVLGNLAVRNDLRKLVEAEGASKAVIAALLTLDTCADIQEVGCIALMNLTADSQDNKIRIKNAGAVAALVNTLKEFQYSCDIVLCALKALGNLVSLEEVCHQFLDENGLDALISLIETHENHEEILVFVSLVLCGITELPDLKMEQASLVDSRLMSILGTFPHNADVNLCVCQAFENLIKTDIGREIFGNGTRMQVVLSAMQTFQDNLQIHRCCCKVIAVISLSVDVNKRLITGTTLESVLESMKLFPLDLELQIIGCGTLACLLDKTGNSLKEKLLDLGGLPLIGRALSAHQTDSRLAVVAVMVIDHLMPIDHKSHPVEAALAKQTILKCMRAFSENKEVQISGCDALSKSDILCESEIIEVSKNVIEAIRRHGREPEVQRSAAAALKPYYKLGEEPYACFLEKELCSPTLPLSEPFWSCFSEQGNRESHH